MRACRILREAAKETSAKQYAYTADAFQYYKQPKGFWDKLRQALVANPTINTGTIEVTKHRYPQPGSREETYAKPASQASDPAQNYYYNRDARRDYPQTHAVTQSQLSNLLLSEAGRPELLGLPNPTVAESDAKALVSSEGTTLAALYAGESKGAAFYGEKRLPPTAPTKRRHKYSLGEPKPVDEHTYWPMVMYK